MIEKQFVETEQGIVAKVTFALPNNLSADKIYLVGDFNDWNLYSHPLRRNGGGWTITVELKPGRAYQFRYLIDGVDWLNDNSADAYVPNRFGSSNFVVVTDPGFERYSEEQQGSEG